MDIKEYLLSVLINENILNLTADNDVYFLHATGAKPPYVEYEVIDEYGADYEEGEEVATTYVVQVDIFSLTDYSELEKVIKSEMKKAGFTRSKAADLYEKETKLNHKAMRFTISNLGEF